MNLVVLIVPFIVYCVIIRTYYMYVLNWIWEIKYDIFAFGIVFLLPALIYLIILFIVNICKPLRIPGTKR